MYRRNKREGYDDMTIADFLIFFFERNGLALLTAVPALMFLIFNPPSNWGE